MDFIAAPTFPVNSPKELQAIKPAQAPKIPPMPLPFAAAGGRSLGGYHEHPTEGPCLWQQPEADASGTAARGGGAREVPFPNIPRAFGKDLSSQQRFVNIS